MKRKSVAMSRVQGLRRLALCTLVLLIACGRPGGTAEDLGSSADKIVTLGPGTPSSQPPPPPAKLGWPSPPVIGSETTGTLPGEGSIGVAGDYRYTLPIEVPPGRAGMAPALSLSYSSSGENGIAGVGWGLAGLSAIRVCNKTFATDGMAIEDGAWCLDGQRLVPSGEDSGAALAGELGVKRGAATTSRAPCTTAGATAGPFRFGPDCGVDSAASVSLTALFWSVRAAVAAVRGRGAERAGGESLCDADAGLLGGVVRASRWVERRRRLGP
jgi:hypothetical protein